MPDEILFVIGGIMMGLLVFTVAYHLINLSIIQSQKQAAQIQFNNLYAKIETVCQQEVQNSMTLNVLVPVYVRVIYASDDSTTPLPTVTDHIKNGETSNGNNLCFQFKDEQEVRCQQLRCPLELPYMGALEASNDIQLMINKILGKALTKEYTLTLARTQAGVAATFGVCNGVGETCAASGECCLYTPYCWGDIQTDLRCNDKCADAVKFADSDGSCCSSYLNANGQCENPLSPGVPPTQPPGTFAWPVNVGTPYFTTCFGWTGSYYFHAGIDVGMYVGTDILASADGDVVEAEYDNGWGNTVILRHVINGETYYTLYGHFKCNGIDVNVGDHVLQGQKLGISGGDDSCKGHSTGPHLHFEIRYDKNTLTSTINPCNYLDNCGVCSSTVDCTYYKQYPHTDPTCQDPLNYH